MSIIHQVIPLHTGLKPHVLSAYSSISPSKGTVILLHGFPDTNWGWRHLLKPIARAGFDVFVPSMRGYGPHDADFLNKDEDLCSEYICNDIKALMTALCVEKAIIVGHDWGGGIAWNFCCHHPERTLAVASFCTPFFPAPPVNPWPKILANPGRFAYQIFFHSEDAPKLFEEDLQGTVRANIRASTDEPLEGEDVKFLKLMHGAEKVIGQHLNKGGEVSPKSKLLTDDDMKVYVRQFKESGFRNPMRWYRNVERNWVWNQKIAGKRVTMPALMVTAENDDILTPSMTKGMEVHFDNLVIEHVKQSSHWILQEQPDMCASILTKWLVALPSLENKSKL